MKRGLQDRRFLGERRQAQDGREAQKVRQVGGSEERDSSFPCRACLALHAYLLLAYVHTSPISFALASNKGNRRFLGAGQPCAYLRLASHAGVFRELVFRPYPQLYFDTLIQVSCSF